MKSQEIFEKSCKYIPGGVNSPVRAFKSVGGNPLIIKSAKDAYLFDVDGNKYVDYVCSWGAIISGHANTHINQEVNKAVENGLSFGAPTELELNLAQRICDLIPSMDKIRFVSSGTEATMSTLRLARGFTGKNKIIKFTGCYHGHSDGLLVDAGSGALTLGVPSSPGVPESFASETLNAEYNNLEDVGGLFAKYPGKIAAVIVEPVAGNMNCVLPKKGFLQGLRELCDEHRAVLIFDEVMTGFRVGLTGAQGHYGVNPDLTTFGKVIGGGMPVGAFGGKKEIMDYLAPQGPVYQAGTLSGNPITMAAGLAALDNITQPNFYENLSKKTEKLITGLTKIFTEKNIKVKTNYLGGMFGIFFAKDNSDKKIELYRDVMACDKELFNKFFHHMLKNGVYLAPSAFEAGFISSAHSDADIEKTLEAAKAFLDNS